MLYFLPYSLFTFTVTQTAHCHEDESSALLQFTQSFVINNSASVSPLSHPKTLSWKPSTNCCAWDGVECDNNTGYVIGLDLGSSQLYGSLGSDSSLFHLVQLQSLNLSDNHFNYSQIPPRFGNLSTLKMLDLSQSKFSGKFPMGLFDLPNLWYLSVALNQDLAGYLPKFHSNRLLQDLELQGTSFQGNLPASIGNLNALNVLLLGNCNFLGPIPPSLSNLTQLTALDLSYNHFKGNLPSSLSNLTQLRVLSVAGNDITSVNISWIGKLNTLYRLDLSTMNISSEIPNSFANLTQLSHFIIQSANLIGQIPPWMNSFTNLNYLDLSGNKLQGEIPPAIFSLENLSYIDLCQNFLTGHLELNRFFNLKRLTGLCLSDNNLTLLTNTGFSNASLPRSITTLRLASCNINEFPELLKDQDELEVLDLSLNHIHGTVPSWMWKKENLWELMVSNNLLTGEIPPLICNLKSLEFLDLSFNHLSGIMPPCLGTFSQKLQTLKLRNNNLFGFLPQTFIKSNALKMIDFSQNKLQGHLPKALANCRMLEFLDVSNNQINDSFPFWLGTLPELKVLVLRSNKFSGGISSPGTFTFPKLHIIDLSQNDFSGNLPPEIIRNWESMRSSNVSQLKYEQWYHYYKEIGNYWGLNYSYSFTIFIKGNLLDYEKVQQIYYFIAIDLSSNKLGGEIPDVIGDLKGLISLNLSNNLFTGGIPSSLGKLSQLEALDLSHNGLSGKIPQELTQLTFLGFFSVSYNHLSGPIPQNTQLNRFESSSFEGNQGLCGTPLKECEDHAKSPLAPPSAPDEDEDEDSGSLFEFDWTVVVIGYGGGLVFGLAMGSILNLEKYEWLKRARTRVQRRWLTGKITRRV